MAWVDPKDLRELSAMPAQLSRVMRKMMLSQTRSAKRTQPLFATQPAPVDVRVQNLVDAAKAGVRVKTAGHGDAIYFNAMDGSADRLREAIALLSAQPSADAGDADEERLLGPREEHFGRAYIDAACADGVWTHPDHVFEFIEKRARELHEAAIAAQREAGEG